MQHSAWYMTCSFSVLWLFMLSVPHKFKMMCRISVGTLTWFLPLYVSLLMKAGAGVLLVPLVSNLTYTAATSKGVLWARTDRFRQSWYMSDQTKASELVKEVVVTEIVNLPVWFRKSCHEWQFKKLCLFLCKEWNKLSGFSWRCLAG